jgi:hypothetical protein
MIINYISGDLIIIDVEITVLGSPKNLTLSKKYTNF